MRGLTYGADDDLPGDLRGRERGVGGRGDSGRGGSPVDGANAGGIPSAGGSPPADAACQGEEAAAPAPAPGARHRQARQRTAARQARGVRARLHRHELSWCCCRAAPHGRPRAPPSGTLRHNLCEMVGRANVHCHFPPGFCGGRGTRSLPRDALTSTINTKV